MFGNGKSCTYSTETDGSRTHADVLGDLNKCIGHLRRVGTAGLDTNGGDLGAGRVQEGGSALHGVEGGGLAAGDCSKSINYCPLWSFSRYRWLGLPE